MRELEVTMANRQADDAITEEMIRAGVSALNDFTDLEASEPALVARAVFEAMLAVRQSSAPV